jgi:hypothetical protein
MENVLIYAALITSTISILGSIFVVYKFFRDPDIKIDKEMGISQIACVEKHKRIDEVFSEIKESIKDLNHTFALFRQNDFHHIEENTGKINERMATIEGQNIMMMKILTEVLNKK